MDATGGCGRDCIVGAGFNQGTREFTDHFDLFHRSA
jgi:hypothetical protein